MQKAVYYLSRFDHLVGGYDDLYDIYAEQDRRVMKWLDEQEETHPSYEKQIQEQVVEKAAGLDDIQKLQWMLLTMARFCELFRRISALPGFEEVDRLGEVVDYFCRGLCEKLGEDVEKELDEYNEMLSDIFDSELMRDYTNRVALPGQESFVPADLEGGDVGTYFLLFACDVLQEYGTEREVTDDIDIEFAACGILADYYYRTTDAEVSGLPKVQEETTRIFADYDFVKGKPDRESLAARIEGYKKIMLV